MAVFTPSLMYAVNELVPLEPTCIYYIYFFISRFLVSLVRSAWV